MGPSGTEGRIVGGEGPRYYWDVSGFNWIDGLCGDEMKDIFVVLFGRVRPQIFLAIFAGTTIAIVVSYFAYKMGAVEIMTAVVGSVFGYLAGVSQKILENDGEENERGG